MATSIKDMILGFDDVQREVVEVPQWGGVKVAVVGLSGTARDAFEGSLMVGKGKKTTVSTKNMRAKLVQKTAHDPESGELIFDIADVVALGKKSGAAIDILFAKAQELSGMSDEDVAELEGN